MGVGSSCHALKDYAAASRAFLQVADAVPPGEQAPLAAVNAANCLYLAEQYDLARKVYGKLLDNPKGADLHRKAFYFDGLCLVKQEKFESAAGQFAKALKAPVGDGSTDPAEIRSGPVNAIVPSHELPSHHGPDVRTVVKDIEVFSTAVVVPISLSYTLQRWTSNSSPHG